MCFRDSENALTTDKQSHIVMTATRGKADTLSEFHSRNHFGAGDSIFIHNKSRLYVDENTESY